jgi:hypothetical protein
MAAILAALAIWHWLRKRQRQYWPEKRLEHDTGKQQQKRRVYFQTQKSKDSGSCVYEPNCNYSAGVSFAVGKSKKYVYFA